MFKKKEKTTEITINKPKKKIKKWKIVVLVIVLLIVVRTVVGIVFGSGKDMLPAVDTAEAVKGEITSTLDTSGTIASEVTKVYASPVNAQVLDVPAEAGGKVQKGEYLLTYDTTSEKMKEALELLKSIPKRVENVSSNPSDIVAVFTEYSDSALVIMYIYFIEKQGDILGVTSNMNMEILAAFNKAGLNLAFPTRTVYIQKDESLKQES